MHPLKIEIIFSLLTIYRIFASLDFILRFLETILIITFTLTQPGKTITLVVIKLT